MIPKLIDVISGLDELAPFPQVAVRVLELSMEGDPDPVDLALIIKLDAAMTAKVLRLANSAAYGTAVEISSIEQAAIKLGSNEVARLAMTSGVHGFYTGLGSSSPRSNHSLWVESVTNAIAARLVAQDRDRPRPDLHYTVGLLMNIGHMVLDRFLRESRDDVLAKLDQGQKMLRVEKEVFGLTHAELGTRLARRWDFPELLIDAIRSHHAPEQAADPELSGDVNVAEALTWDLLKEDGVRSLAYGVSGATLKRTGTTTPDLLRIRSMLPGAVEAQRYLLGLG